jgi:hypothetical protein
LAGRVVEEVRRAVKGEELVGRGGHV